MKLAMVMDPIEHIHPEKDTSFALLLAAQKRQWSIFYIKITDLFLYAGNAYAHAKKIRVVDQEKNFFGIQERITLPLSEFDVIFMRKEPPVDQAFLHATQILDFAEKQGVKVFNKPQSLRDYNEKLITHYFPQLCPETVVSAKIDQIKQFVYEHKEVVCKPLDGMGGKTIFKIKKDDPNLPVILETLTEQNKTLIVCQQFIPAIKYGDKRIILVNGDPIPYGLARIPKEGEIRGNLASGGLGQAVKLSAHDFQICETIGPFLKEKSILLAGIDVIGDYLTEINITSPTCVREIEAAFDIDICGKILEFIV